MALAKDEQDSARSGPPSPTMEPNTGQRWPQARARKSPTSEAPTPSDALPPMTKSRRKRAGSSSQLLVDPQVPMLDVEAALKEITLVPAATIHRAAAFTWASRAIAGYRVCAGKRAIQEGLSYLYLGEHYREAALAHAAMGEAWQPLFAEIDEAMAKDRQLAFTSMRGRSPVATR